MNMVAFYVLRGHNLDELANLSYIEKVFLHCAKEAYYEEEKVRYGT